MKWKKADRKIFNQEKKRKATAEAEKKIPPLLKGKERGNTTERESEGRNRERIFLLIFFFKIREHAIEIILFNILKTPKNIINDNAHSNKLFDKKFDFHESKNIF